MNLLEICVENLQSACIAQESGADRIELCDNLGEGGTTPSHGIQLMCIRQLDIPVHVLIRPRGGDFCYSNDDFAIIKEDILHTRELGASGIVSGALTRDRQVAQEQTLELIKLSKPLSFTFHRAFDQVKDPFVALELLIELGVDRILTSGQRATASDGALLIKKLNKQADGRIIVMPGGGVSSTNLDELIYQTSCIEFHGTARRRPVSDTSGIKGMPSDISGLNDAVISTDDQEVRLMKDQLG